MNQLSRMSQNRKLFGFAWVALGLALYLHVADEALNDFLSVYNPAVLKIKGLIPFLPLPVFTFKVWLAGLLTGISLFLLFSPWAFRGASWMKFLALPLAVLMTLNALGHLFGSLYWQRWMPGVYSSPLLLAASIFLFQRTRSFFWADLPR